MGAQQLHRVIVDLVDHLLRLDVQAHDVVALAIVLVGQLELARIGGMRKVQLERRRPRLLSRQRALEEAGQRKRLVEGGVRRLQPEEARALARARDQREGGLRVGGELACQLEAELAVYELRVLAAQQLGALAALA